MNPGDFIDIPGVDPIELARYRQRLQLRVERQKRGVGSARPNSGVLRERSPDTGKIRFETTNGGEGSALPLFSGSYQQGATYPLRWRGDQALVDGKSSKPIKRQYEDDVDEEVEDAAGPIKWLLTSVRESTQELIVRVGGHKEEPDIALTLQLLPGMDNIYEIYPENYAGNAWSPGQDVYFSFRLDNTGPGVDDWVISYGKFQVNPGGSIDYNGWTETRSVTLYRVTPGRGAEVVYENSNVFHQAGYFDWNYDAYNVFYPIGYGNWFWLYYTEDTEGPIRVQTYYEAIAFNRLADNPSPTLNYQPAGFSFQIDDADIYNPPEAVRSGNSVVLPAVDGNSAETRPYSNTERWTNYYINVSESGNTSIGCKETYEGYTTYQFTFFARRGDLTAFNTQNSPYYPSAWWWEYDSNSPVLYYIGWFSAEPVVTDDYVYGLTLIEPRPVYGGTDDRLWYDNAEMLFEGQRELYVQRWDTSTGEREVNWKTVSYYGFTLPADEFDEYVYPLTMQIKYFPVEE